VETYCLLPTPGLMISQAKMGNKCGRSQATESNTYPRRGKVLFLSPAAILALHLRGFLLFADVLIRTTASYGGSEVR